MNLELLTGFLGVDGLTLIDLNILSGFIDVLHLLLV